MLQADVAGACYAVLAAQQHVALAADSGALATRAAEAVRKRVAAGKVSPVHETRARVDQAQAKLEGVEAQAELRGAPEALAALWGERELPGAAAGRVAQI